VTPKDKKNKEQKLQASESAHALNMPKHAVVHRTANGSLCRTFKTKAKTHVNIQQVKLRARAHIRIVASSNLKY
jgi:hypothetical protein